MKKILVIIPFYNVEKYLEGAIESVLQQTYKNIELVLVNDGSIDNSLRIAESYAHLDNVTVISNSENKGCYYSRNKGLYKFKDQDWDYFTIHDSDDISDINRFEILLKFLTDNSNIIGLKTGFVRKHYDTDEIDILNGRPHIGSSEGIAIYSRIAFDNIGYFDDTRFSGDTDYLWRLGAWINSNNLQYELREHTEVLYIAYLHETNLTKKYNWTYDRPQYWAKSQNDINQMIKINNFYRKWIQ